MIHKNLLYWLLPPDFEFQDGDIVYGGNLYNQGLVDKGKKVRFVGVNLKGCTTTLPQLPEDRNAIGEITPEPEPMPIVNTTLAAKATAARALLAKSSKLLDPAISAYLDGLEQDVRQEANASDLPLGESATILVQEMIDTPEVQNNPELRMKLETALAQVVAMTGGVL
jgi:hypothetical protein